MYMYVKELLLKKGVLASLGALLKDADEEPSVKTSTVREELLHLCLESLCIIVKEPAVHGCT